MTKVGEDSGVLGAASNVTNMEHPITKDNTEEETLEQLIAKITHPDKLAYLEEYPKSRRHMLTCAKIGIGESTPRAWTRDDGVFLNAVTLIKKAIQEDKIAIHEQNIEDVALSPDTKDQSRIFGSLVILRAEAPDKYREKSVTETKLTGNITVKMAIPRPDAPQIQEVKPVQIESGEKEEQ